MMGISSNGIVAAADTRRTIKTQNQDIRYLDTTIKVLKFHNFVINYANVAMIEDLLVGDWLLEKLGDKEFHTPFDVFHFILKKLPEHLKNKDANDSITFLCGMYVDNSPMIVEMTTFNQNIQIITTELSVVTWRGSGGELAGKISKTDLAIQWSKFNRVEMKNVFNIVGWTVINIAQVSANQTIGGKILTETLLRPTSDLQK